MMLPRCSICNNKKSTFLSEGSGWLYSLGLNTPQNALWNALIDKIVYIYFLKN